MERESDCGSGAAADVFHRLGTITRQLHDALDQLGLMPKLQDSAAGLPDARARLDYVARKTGEAADRVLNAVDQAKRERNAIDALARGLAAAPAGEVGAIAQQVGAAAARIDEHLTDIMLAQDFHDLTGQVVGRVVKLVIELESSLVGLLVQAAPAESASRPAPRALEGPQVGAKARDDVVSDQNEVDDLLASMGF